MVLGLGIPVDEEQIGGMEHFLATMHGWRMPATSDGITRTATYMQKLYTQSYFSTAIQIPCIFNGKAGCIVAVSTSASTRRMMENMAQEAAGQIIVEPHWMLYDVWWFDGLVPFNFVGMTMAMFNGTQLSGNLGMLVDTLCADRGIADWKGKYLVCLNMEYSYGLRRFVHEVMGCSVWLEMTFGYSMQAYNALDMYVSAFTFGIQPPRESAWYLLNSWQDPMYRQEMAPEDWWRCIEHMIGMGQREAISEWKLMNWPAIQARLPHTFRYTVPGMTPPSRM